MHHKYLQQNKNKIKGASFPEKSRTKKKKKVLGKQSKITNVKVLNSSHYNRFINGNNNSRGDDVLCKRLSEEQKPEAR